MRKILLIAICSLISLSSFAQQSIAGKPKSLDLSLNQNVPTYTLAPLNVEALLAEDVENGKNGVLERSALIRPTNLNLNNAGVWTELENGDRIWRLVIHAEDAYATTLLYKNFYLPEGASLYVYKPNYTQIIGAYTNANNHDSKEFSTELIHGDKCVLEYYEPASQAYNGSLTIEGVAHLYKQLPSDMADLGFSDSDGCQVNVNCSEGNSWQDIKKGVARIFVVSGTSGGWCTGSLVNNTNLDCTPYFLTAYHCGDGSSTSDFNQWTFYFNYEATGCTSPTSESTIINGNPDYFSVSGCSVVASSNNGGSSSSDVLLVEFNSAISSSEEVFYNGWDRSLLNTVTTNGVGIHHPSGDIKKISTYTQSLTTTGWNNSGLNTHYQVYWASTSNGHGVTEGGSSGSPIFNDQGLIIGTLTGGGSYCNATSASDNYGKMSYHWNSNGTANNRRVDVHLDPVGNGSATSITGSSSPCSATSSLDAGIFAINSPTAQICGNSFVPEVVLRNYGSSTLTSCQIVYQVNSTTAQTYNWSGSLSSGSNTTVFLNAMNANTGTNSFTVNTQNPNNGTDQNSGNNSSTISFDATIGATLPLTQDFQATTFPATTYTVDNGDADVTWSRTTSAGFNSTASMYLDNWDYNASGAYDWFILPALDLSNAPNATLSYDYAYAYYDGNAGVSYDSLAVAYSLDCGDNWFALSFEGGVQLATAGGQGTEFTPSTSDWDNVVVDLSQTPVAGESNVIFAFVAVNGYGNNLFVDNINVETSSPVQIPTADFTVSTTNNCVGNNVSFTSTSTENPSSYAWTFPGATPATSTAANPTVMYTNPGVYSVTLLVTNSAGSDTEVKTNYITVTAAPVLNVVVTGATCNGVDDGTAVVNVSGGTAPFNYTWSGISSSSSSLNNLEPGSYAVTVTDANACVSLGAANITSSVFIDVDLTVVDSSVQHGVSSIYGAASGGSMPYTYSWNNGETTESITNLANGLYTLLVTDMNGCQGASSASIGNVGIKNPDWLTYVSLYPNPTSAELHVDIALESKEDLNLKVYNNIGQVIYEKTLEDFQSGIEKVNLSDVAEGIYFLRISDAINAKVLRFIKK